MFRFFESRVPRALPPPPGADHRGPPAGLLAFYWYYIGQTRGLFVAMSDDRSFHFYDAGAVRDRVEATRTAAR